MKFVNLTPHAINIVDADGNRIMDIPASGSVARCAVSIEQVGAIGDVPITQSVYGDVRGLPDPKPDTYYIVSALVAQSARDRTDVFIPNELTRDANGVIIGCRSLGMV